MEKIIGIGNALTDVLAILDNDKPLEDMQLPKGTMHFVDQEKLVKINTLLSTHPVSRATGGSAGNTIKALATLGVPCGFIGKTGPDETGRFYEESFKQKGIDTEFCHSPLPSGIAYDFVTPDGERTFCDYLGAAATLTADDLLSEMFRGYSYLYIEGYLVQNHALIKRAIELARLEGLQVCLDLASYNIVEQDREFFDTLVTDYVDIVFANEEEARAFTGMAPQAAIGELSKRCSIVVVKTGSKGSLIKKGADTVSIAPCTVERVVDTTGAGDYYAAGFLYGLMRGISIAKCGKIGSLLASYIIQEIGADLEEAKWNQIKLKIQSIIAE